MNASPCFCCWKAISFNFSKENLPFLMSCAIYFRLPPPPTPPLHRSFRANSNKQASRACNHHQYNLWGISLALPQKSDNLHKLTTQVFPDHGCFYQKLMFSFIKWRHVVKMQQSAPHLFSRVTYPTSNFCCSIRLVCFSSMMDPFCLSSWPLYPFSHPIPHCWF